MKKHVSLIIAFVGALVLTFGSTYLSAHAEVSSKASSRFNMEDAIVKQKVIAKNDEKKEISTIYLRDQMIGTLKDGKKLDKLLKRVYKERYEKDFPNSKIGLGEDIHVRKFMSMFEYENKDQEILDYLDKQDMFSVQVNKIEFSNGETVFVKNIEDFTQARDEYIQNYVDKESFTRLSNHESVDPLTTYGVRITNFKVLETAEISKGLAPESRILKNKEEASLYFSYGYDADFDYYTTVEYDTVEGVAWLHAMSAQHLLSINSDKIKAVNQVLPVGLKLNVSQLNSPISVEVKKEGLESQVVYPDPTETIYDDTLREGTEIIEQSAEVGSKDVKYEETYVNGALKEERKIISERVTVAPVREVVRVGTKIEPKIGSGKFRYPVDAPLITCPWMCYAGHQAMDIQNAGYRYGNVYAADRGVVVTNSYTSVNGNYMVIDHNNGFVTYYGHMATPGYFQPGQTVRQGEVIGPIGMTGFATGPHVHFEIRVNGVRVNPAYYLP